MARADKRVLELVPPLWWIRARAFALGAFVGAAIMFTAMALAR